MKRFFILVVIAGLIAVISGCGGGGGGSSSSGTTTLGDSIITGKVVSTKSGSPGVADVIVRLGTTTLTATTDSDGNFQLDIGSSSAGVPAYLQIDPSGAGTGYSKSYTVKYRNQTFLSNNITIPATVRNGSVSDLGTFTITYVDGEDMPPVPFTSKNTVLTGRIVSSSTAAGISGVKVSFGTPSYTATTGAKGYFEIDLGLEAAVDVLLPGSHIFSIDTSNAGSDYPTSLLVSYSGSSTLSQSSIPVPDSIYNNTSTDFGVITVITSSSSSDDDDDDDDDPPIPPAF
ncbi:hypothetical protein LLG46_10210 [bacterium]|nr:hypothetical protein [bacterium]